MHGMRAAYRYALALFGVAEELKKLNEAAKDFEYLETLIAVREFYLFLKSPVIKTEKKKQTLRNILHGKVSDVTMKFVLLLASKGREALLPDIIPQFFALQDKRLGILRVTARTAIKFTQEQERQLVRQLEQVTKKKIRLTSVLDPSLHGGFLVQHEDTVWDASVRRQLERFKQRLIEGMV
jgi:F-type H+-transporting ATPase subunit delta